jgi:SAM-dependent methyltransferase
VKAEVRETAERVVDVAAPAWKEKPAGRLAPVTYTDSKSEYVDLGPLQTRIETHRLYSERPEDVEQAVLDAFSLHPNDALLDVGSGTGSFLARLWSQGHRGRLVGLDTSPAAIDELRRLQGVEAVLGDAAVLPFAEAEFSVVTAVTCSTTCPSPLLRFARPTGCCLRVGGLWLWSTSLTPYLRPGSSCAVSSRDMASRYRPGPAGHACTRGRCRR